MFRTLLILMLQTAPPAHVTADDFASVLGPYVRETAGSGGVHAEWSFRTVPSGVTAPSGRYSLRVAGTAPVSPKGHVGVPVEVVSGGKAVRTVVCSIYIRTFEDVYVAVRPLRKHEELSADVLAVRRIETTTVADPYPVLAPVTGYRTRRMVSPNSVIRTSLIEELPAVRRDERVSLLVRSSNLTIGASGVAKDDGRIGEVIPVQRAGTKELVRAKVVGQQIVEVENH
ncbi:MAG: flagellar basal body P-ring formation protein FlgA [Bacteroidetes bacterium]|nr:MAG: flagellar basal body P-ring formation protein FlgA [Bacteroidota bacterium]